LFGAHTTGGLRDEGRMWDMVSKFPIVNSELLSVVRMRPERDIGANFGLRIAGGVRQDNWSEG
jgi:hypothetical protein